MYTVSLGGMQLKGWRFFLRTIRQTYKALRAARATDGCMHAEIFRRGRTYFVMSVWTSEAAMTGYAGSGIHQAMMPQAKIAMRMFRNENWQSETIPDQETAIRAWNALG